MPLIDKHTLLNELSPPFDHLLCTQLLDEFISAERRFIQRDWGPTELDGGQFCEIVGRILYHLDSNNLNQNKKLEDCLKYLEGDQNPHALSPRTDILHISRVIKTIYKFRSQRGAVHISATYSPNHMDSKFVIESIRWVMNELLRIFWSGDRDAVARAIRELLQFDVPCVGIFEDIILVQRTDLSAEEEILVLLHYSGESGFTRAQLGKILKCSPAAVTRALQKLSSSSVRQIVLLPTGAFRLTDLGSRRVREQLAEKLHL